MCKILVVENNAKIRKAMRDLLSGAGYSVDAVPSAEAGIQLAFEEQYEVAIVDIKLGGAKSGFDLIESTNGNLKYIIVTGVDTHSARERAQELQVQAFIPKPYDEVELVKAVDKHAYDKRSTTHVCDYRRRGIGEDVSLENIHNRVSVLAGRIERMQEADVQLKDCYEALREEVSKDDIRLVRMQEQLEHLRKDASGIPKLQKDITSLKEKVVRSETNWGLLVGIGINIVSALLTSGIVYLVVTQAIEALSK